MASYIRKTICPYDCPTSCGLLAETDGIRILGVKGDPDHPAAKGLICRKMQHYEQSVHSPERILTPMKRVGAKGEGRFEPITWDAAVKEIAGRWSRILEEDGSDAIPPMYYSGVMSVLQRKCGDAFFNRMGACDMVRTLCSSAKGAGYEAVMGADRLSGSKGAFGQQLLPGVGKQYEGHQASVHAGADPGTQTG